MVEWLGQTRANPRDRANAYGLLPDVDREASTLEGSCAALVELAFADAIADRPILLTEEGELVAAEVAIVVPLQIFDIWPAEKAMALLDEKSRPALCRSEEHTSELQSPMRNSYAVFCLKKKTRQKIITS